MTIIQNAIKITDGVCITYLKSNHRHDYVGYHFLTGGYIAIDGGTNYFRKCGDFDRPEIEDWSLTSESSEEEIYDKTLWGVRNWPSSEFVYEPLKDLTLDHIKSIWKMYKNKVADHIKFVIKKRLQIE